MERLVILFAKRLLAEICVEERPRVDTPCAFSVLVKVDGVLIYPARRLVNAKNPLPVPNDIVETVSKLVFTEITSIEEVKMFRTWKLVRAMLVENDEMFELSVSELTYPMLPKPRTVEVKLD